jgi:hypothetical protein
MHLLFEVYVDLKAYDCWDWNRLCCVLESYNLTGSALNETKHRYNNTALHTLQREL